LSIAHLQPEKEPGRPTILLVEDDIIIRSPLAEYLQSVGFITVEAANAGEAITLFAARVPIDLVFSDIRMPGPMDGLGLAQWIRQHQPGVPVLLTSGTSSVARARQVGAVFVAKPYQVAEIAARIRDLLASETPSARSEAPPGAELLPDRRRRAPTGRPASRREANAPKPMRPPGSGSDDEGLGPV
jgi:two-component system, response regulator PdtaR